MKIITQTQLLFHQQKAQEKTHLKKMKFVSTSMEQAADLSNLMMICILRDMLEMKKMRWATSEMMILK